MVRTGHTIHRTCIKYSYYTGTSRSIGIALYAVTALVSSCNMNVILQSSIIYTDIMTIVTQVLYTRPICTISGNSSIMYIRCNLVRGISVCCAWSTSIFNAVLVRHTDTRTQLTERRGPRLHILFFCFFNPPATWENIGYVHRHRSSYFHTYMSCVD